MQLVNLILFKMILSTLWPVERCMGQFKIVDLGYANKIDPNSGKISVNLVQIKPLIQVNDSNTQSPFVKKPVRFFRKGVNTADMPQENKFITLQIVNASALKNNSNYHVANMQPMSGGITNKLLFRGRITTTKLITRKNSNLTFVDHAKRKPQQSNTSAPTISPITGLKLETYPSEDRTQPPQKADRNKYRSFKSRCRCERLWNCARIQISVARCAPDFFICCF
uniref:Uncharacterized protein n=1 Tax=Anopheles atroparvus TaxID=41427 RepID=A0AAG5D1Z1_ANOAO